MKKFTKFILLAIAAFFMSPVFAAHLTDRLLLSARMDGMQEVPMVTTNATGVAGMQLSSMRDTLYVNVSANGLSGPIQGIHIHMGMIGENGGVVIDLSSYVVGNRVYAVLTDLGSEIIEELLMGNYYLNLHTTMHPNGEIRGQIQLETDYLMMADLDGMQEVPMVDTDAIGKASFVLSKDMQELKIRIVLDGLSGDIMGAHIHAGAMGENGGVILDLTDFIDGNMILAAIDPMDFVNELMSGMTYINVHTELNPSGEIRGQILWENVLGFDALLNGAQEVPAFSTPAVGLLSVMIPSTLDEIWYDCVFTGLTGGMPEGAHFHEGAIGTNGGVIIDLSDNITANRITGMISGAMVTPELINEFLKGNIYINIHNTANGGNGEIRGQVFRVAREGYSIALDGEQEVPSFNTPAKGAGIVSIDRDQTNAHYMVVVAGLSDEAMGAHFHKNVVGENGAVIYDLGESLVAQDGDASLFGYWRVGFALQNSVMFRNDSVYVNIHTSANGGAGEVRGQVLRSSGEYIVNGIDEFSLMNELPFDLYPNPTAGEISIRREKIAKSTTILSVRDLTGKECFRRSFNSSFGGQQYTVSLGELNPGVYQVILNEGEFMSTQKLIIQ